MSSNFLATDLLARFALLNTANTELHVGYDDLFTEPRIEAANASDRVGAVGRREDQVTVRVQVEQRSAGRLQQFLTGRQPERIVELTAEWRELEEAGLLDAQGWPKIRDGARLVKLMDRDGIDVHLFPLAEGGLFVDEVEVDPHVFGVPRSVTWRLVNKAKGVR